MGDLSKNFSRSEFACKCGCGFDTADSMMVDVLQSVRDYFGVRVTITSGCRCPTHNKAEGGADDSQHLWARADDIVVEGVAPARVAVYVECTFPWISVGIYDDSTHIDSRSGEKWRGGEARR